MWLISVQKYFTVNFWFAASAFTASLNSQTQYVLFQGGGAAFCAAEVVSVSPALLQSLASRRLVQSSESHSN